MNILAVNNFKIPHFYNAKSEPQTAVTSSYGLTMAEPLSKDTVSFKGGIQQSVKSMNSRKDAVTLQLARKVRNKFVKPHEKLKKLLLSRFEGFLSTDKDKNILTFSERVKSEDSIREKTATNGWKSEDDIMRNIGDISGFCFVLEDKVSMSMLVKILSRMVKKGEIEIENIEYHRLATEYDKRGRLIQSYDSLPRNELQSLKQSILKYTNLDESFWKEVDSKAGYSALHINIKNKNGTRSEIQVMPRRMKNVKHVDDLIYKLINGKTVAPRYTYIKQLFAPFKIKDPENPTKQEKALHNAMKEYRREVFEAALNDPYEDIHEFPKPSNPLIKPYDYNILYQFIKVCEGSGN